MYNKGILLKEVILVMDKEARVVKRVRETYRDYDILLERERGWYYYSVLDPNGREITSAFRYVDCPLGEMVQELRGKVDNHAVAMSIEEFITGKHNVNPMDFFLQGGGKGDKTNN